MCELLCEVMSMCYKITQETKAHCFFEYSGHTDCFTVLCFPDGWHPNMEQGEFNKCYVMYYTAVNEENLIIASYRLRKIARNLGVEL